MNYGSWRCITVAKQLIEIINVPTSIKYNNPDTKQCICGYSLTQGEHEFIESKVLKGRFCDISCLIRADGAKWTGCTIIDEFGDSYTEQKYMKVMEAS
jgi:hypothetical protein